jgi:predicted  nucleic acid-binding Zn-ribbon protein
MEGDRDSLTKKIDDAKKTIESSEKEKTDLEKKLADAREELKKLEALSGSNTKDEKQPPDKK